MELSAQAVKKIVKEELPGLMKRDKSIRRFIIELSKEKYTEFEEKTESRFDILLEELRKDREAQSLKWEEQDRKWEEQNRKWDEQNKKWYEMKKEQDKKWEDEKKEREKKDNENREELKRLYKAFTLKHDTTLGALGARWGLRSEGSFRNALKGILGDFNIKVLNVKEYDDYGEVFGHPVEIELDIIIINGKLIISELKSSMSRADMFAFYKKAAFYEKRHERKADRLIVISPMVDPKAWETAKELKIKIYSYADDMGDDIAKEMLSG